MTRYVLDLFHCEGIGADGYAQAGYRVVGVDLARERLAWSPHATICADALDVLTDRRLLARFALIHASPPCQAFTAMSNRWRGQGGKADTHIDLLTPTLELLRGIDRPWIVENVRGAPMPACVELHGGMFGLGVNRPRRFASSHLLMAAPAPRCRDAIGVYGRYPDGRTLWRKPDGRLALRAPRDLAEAAAAMGVDRPCTWDGLRESIPPAYTRWLAEQLP